MIDIDYFKLFNDTYGHPAGDECLKIVVEAISGIVRDPPDVFVRYGGEEFVCLLPGANIESTGKVGERILKAIHERNIPHSNSSVAEHVTVSIGGASLVPATNQLCGTLIENADKKLYRAKRSGRNRLIVD
jgi:diguanylate cyclase (GGDEF)-like protein